jgi:hypothetical protein
MIHQDIACNKRYPAPEIKIRNKMVELASGTRKQFSSLLFLPEEIRTQIWRYLLSDSKVVFKNYNHNRSLSIDRSQILTPVSLLI